MSRRRARITPDEVPATLRCRTFFYPDNEQWSAAVDGAIFSLSLEDDWEQVTGVTVAEAAAAGMRIYEGSAREICMLFVGQVAFSAGVAVPNGWLRANGGLYEKDEYPDLWAAIGNVYGESGSTFAVPDIASRIIGGSGAGNPLASVAGNNEKSLSTAEMPPHTHSVLLPAIGITVSPGGVPPYTGAAVGATGSAGDGSSFDLRQATIHLTALIFSGVFS